MPAQYKILISVLVIIIGIVVFYFDTQSGGGAARWVALALGPAMVLAIWMFPEPKAKGNRPKAKYR